MFQRFRRNSRDPRDETNHTRDGVPVSGGDGYGGTAVMDRPATATATAPATRRVAAPAGRGGRAPASAAEARAIQREHFGGPDGTAIVFGWLAAVGLAAVLLAVVAAAGTRLGYAADVNSNAGNAGTIGIVGAAILVVVLLFAYFSGGYAAGRMARFDGARQGFRVWLLGVVATLAAGAAGWIGSSRYNVFEQLHLPRIPVDEGSLATGAVITLAVVLVGTVLAAMAGGKAGARYHARVDATAWERNS
jgi:hypothetical protein